MRQSRDAPVERNGSGRFSALTFFSACSIPELFDADGAICSVLPDFNTKIYIYVSFQSLKYRTTFLSTTFLRLVGKTIPQRASRCESRLGNFIQSKSYFKPNRRYNRQP